MGGGTVPVLLQSLQLVSGQGGRRQLDQPAQHAGGEPAGCLHAHALPRVLVPAKASARAQAPPLLLPRRAHGALLPAGLVPDGSGSGSATVLPDGLKIHSGVGGREEGGHYLKIKRRNMYHVKLRRL